MKNGIVVEVWSELLARITASDLAARMELSSPRTGITLF